MNIYTLVIDHRHGTSICSCLSEAEMDARLYAYVKENWYEDDGDIGDLSREEAIETYFHQNPWAEDWYRTDVTELPVLSDLLIALRETHAAALELAKERDPDQLGLWDALFTAAKEAISKVEEQSG